MYLPKFFIYALLDPDTYEIKYIGQSKNGIRRFNISLGPHSLKIKCPKNDWIKNLILKNTIPLFKILECCEFKDLNEREIFWISKHRDQLLNVANGGLGGNTRKSYEKWKPFYAQNIETGEITRFLYIWQAEEAGFSPTKVSAVCKGKRKSHAGHYFSYDEGGMASVVLVKPVFHTKKAIRSIDKKSKEIRNFESIIQASRELGLARETISKTLQGHTKCRTHDFAYEPTNPVTNIEI